MGIGNIAIFDKLINLYLYQGEWFRDGLIMYTGKINRWVHL